MSGDLKQGNGIWVSIAYFIFLSSSGDFKHGNGIWMTSLFHILVLFCLLTVPPPPPSSILFTSPSLSFTTPPLSLSSFLFSSTPPSPAFFRTSSVYLPFVFRSSFLTVFLSVLLCLPYLFCGLHYKCNGQSTSR